MGTEAAFKVQDRSLRRQSAGGRRTAEFIPRGRIIAKIEQVERSPRRRSIRQTCAKRRFRIRRGQMVQQGADERVEELGFGQHVEVVGHRVTADQCEHRTALAIDAGEQRRRRH